MKHNHLKCCKRTLFSSCTFALCSLFLWIIAHLLRINRSVICSFSSGALLVPFSLHRWSSEPSLAHCSLAHSSGQPPSARSSTTTSSTPVTRANPLREPPPSAPLPLRRSESVGRRPLLRHGTAHIPQRDSDYELEPERGRKRAVDNQYTLLWCAKTQRARDTNRLMNVSKCFIATGCIGSVLDGLFRINRGALDLTSALMRWDTLHVKRAKIVFL